MMGLLKNRSPTVYISKGTLPPVSLPTSRVTYTLEIFLSQCTLKGDMRIADCLWTLRPLFIHVHCTQQEMRSTAHHGVYLQMRTVPSSDPVAKTPSSEGCHRIALMSDACAFSWISTTFQS